ncbi:molybdate ABC transporter substrate-binding protein [Isoptericola sp. b490]|uniref:molybdate ABC transporter substrate-binding protein n=1 Tax=Actinotalea lenta TaxID=3064654 RepID=UPI0027131386|nr:molybdate ABC transporter substrate-binding protein [Isoptericola sp. b490]MDO8120300.1 molybdate ABC transporter substrate-binding protein [Isoptericola sp. b490]
MRTRAAALVAVLVVGALAGCGASTTPHTEVTVLAAASLTDVFGSLAHTFEADHPGTTVRLSFAGSSSLVAQALAGAPADVLATADTATMQRAVDADAVRNPAIFADNSVEIAVPPGNPAHVTGLADLADPTRTVALCAPQVPCGAAARATFAAAGLTAAPDTLEQDVRAVLTKVELGEVDAGIVYRTDVAAAGDRVQGIRVPADVAATNDYPIAVLTHAAHPDLAAAFLALVRSSTGAAVLRSAGFGTP